MKPWQLNRRVSSLSKEITDPVKTETKIDWNCLSEPERRLLDKVQEIVVEYASASPPEDVIVKNADLWYKGLEIFARRATELFVEVIPGSLCCDELEAWYFKLYFYNFMRDWLESVQRLRDMPKDEHDALLVERREMGMLDRVFRLPRNPTETRKEQNQAESDKH